MKSYQTPNMELIPIDSSDILTASPGTETPWYEESDGIWEIGVGV